MMDGHLYQIKMEIAKKKLIIKIKILPNNFKNKADFNRVIINYIIKIILNNFYIFLKYSKFN